MDFAAKNSNADRAEQARPTAGCKGWHCTLPLPSQSFPGGWGFLYGKRPKTHLAFLLLKVQPCYDMVSRILRAEFIAGLFDRKPSTQISDVEAGMATAQRVAEEGAVLLKNDHARLPLSPATTHSILLVGGHAESDAAS